MRFLDRTDAGRRLATELAPLRGEHPVVLGLPRGGVPVAYEVAVALDAPLDVIIVRKLGVPFQPELAMGAIGEDGVRILNERVLSLAGITDDELADVEQRERAALDRRAARFRGGRPRVPLAGRTVIVVDDGIATGSTARAACRVARAQGAGRVILAVPVAPPTAVAEFRPDADEVVCLELPWDFWAIGQFYADFSQTPDEEVTACLEKAATRALVVTVSDPDPDPDPPIRDDEVVITAGPVGLPGHLTVPGGAPGIVVFAHGSGSSRHSPRNRFVASVLHRAGLGTLLFDLLTPDEEVDRANVFDIDLLARRLVDATGWLRTQPGAGSARIGYFGASTGAAAALRAAAHPDAEIAAVVSRGGRPDLAGASLAAVRAPTLLIVGGDDHEVLVLNRQAQAALRGENRLAVVAGATHLFEEPGTLMSAAGLARDWFVAHMPAPATAAAAPLTPR
jgi:putative phosphoribosyl transferase